MKNVRSARNSRVNKINALFFNLGPIYREIEDTFYEEEKCGLKQMRYYEFAEPYQAVPKNSPIKEMTKIAYETSSFCYCRFKSIFLHFTEQSNFANMPLPRWKENDYL